MGSRRPQPRRPTAVTRSPPAAGPTRRPDLPIALLLAAGAFLLYVPTLFHDFSDYDDPQYVTANPVVQRGLTAQGVRWAFTTTHFSNWLPVTWLSHMADVSLFGMDAGGHHATSALLHAINAALVFLVLRSMTGRRWPSATAAALFAFHPLRVESVAWIAERKDVLAATFFLLTLLAWDRYTRRPSGGRYGLVMVLYALGLMSKTMLVTLPLLLMLLDGWPLRRLRPAPQGARPQFGPAGLLLEKAPLLALAAVASAWTVLFQQAGGAMRGQQLWSFGQRSANAAVSVVRYLGRTAWPARLSVFYPHPGSWPVWRVAASLALIVALSVAAWGVRRRRPWLLFGWLWFLVMLLPVSGLVQAGLQSMADRYTYLPSIGLAVAVAWGAADLIHAAPRLRRAAAAGAAAVFCLLAACTWHQEAYWASTMDLFGHALAVQGDNWLALDMVGQVYSANGDEAAAAAYYRRAIEANPAFPLPWLHLARGLQVRGRAEEAIGFYRQGLRYGPDERMGHLWFATALSETNAVGESEAEFATAARLLPGDADVYVQKGLGEAARGDKAAARASLEKALRMYPAHPGAKAALAALDSPATAPSPRPPRR